MKIDLVYLWVDGSDPKWIAKKNKFLPRDKQLPLEIAGDCRYVDHDELKYSLRSVERFAPWINHIYIITDGQRPSWLSEECSKVTIVDHSQIIDPSLLPIFNSTILELFAHKIEGLSEHFLYANDDMLFGREVDPSFFFYDDGEPKVRLARQKIKGRTGNYQRKVYRMQMIIKERYGRYYKLAPHHNIDGYRRSDFERVAAEFEAELTKSLSSRFRNDSDLHRSIVNYRLLVDSPHRAIKIGRYNGVTSLLSRVVRFFSKRYITDSRCFPICADRLHERIERYNPALFTINDESRATEEQRQSAVAILERLLPAKSIFEVS